MAVGTRNHPDADYPATPTPSSSTTSSLRSRSQASSSKTLTQRAKSVSRRSSSKPRRSSGAWTHTPSNLTLLWLWVSLPLILWDSAYIFLRPHSMPGGKLHLPLWKPYDLYGTIDYVYGWPAYHNKNGWTAAQGFVNVLETIGYYVYLYIVYSQGVEQRHKGRGAPKKLTFAENLSANVKRLGNARVLSGKSAAIAIFLAYTTTVVTLAKTVLFALNEHFSGWANVGHNPWPRLIVLWILPNGAWLVFPTYMLYVFSTEILEALESAAS